MNYAALSIDELVARCAAGDVKAQAYAGERFPALVAQLEDELRVERDEMFEEAVNIAVDGVLSGMESHVPHDSPYWRIG